MTEVRAGELYMCGNDIVQVVSPHHGRVSNVKLIDGKFRKVDLAKLREATTAEKAAWQHSPS